MTVLAHKNFQGSVKFEGGRLLIQILHIDDFITTECDSASEVVTAFKELVDDYIETCKAINKDPCKPFKGSLNIRIAPELHRRAAMAAALKEESLNSWIGQAIEDRLDEDSDRVQVVAEQLFSRTMTLSEVGSGSRYKSAEFSVLGMPGRRGDQSELLRLHAEAQDIVLPAFRGGGRH